MVSRLLCLFLILLMLSGCGRHKQENRTVFRYNESAGITSLDPAFARSQANLWAINHLYNGLVQLNDKLEVEPCIAGSWDITDSGRSYVFHLREDIYFHDDAVFPNGKGRRVKAGDFLYSFLRLVDPGLAAPGAWVMNYVKNQGGDWGFRAPDDNTFVIELSQSFPPFLGILSMQYCSVVPEEAVQAYGEDFRKHPVGTGPFRFKLWKEGVKLVLVKNENYFEADKEGERLPYLDAVAITFIVDKQSVFLEFVKGNLDFMSGLDASYKDELLTRNGLLHPRYRERFSLQTQPYLNTEYLGFLVDPSLPSSKDNPLLIKEIRQAINLGFDRRKMIRYLRNNIGQPGVWGFVPPGLPSFDSAAAGGYGYDPSRAKELLARAGFPGGKGLPEIRLSTNASYLDLATYIQQQLNELGFNIRLDVHPPASMREMMAQSRVHFFRGSWIADYPDAENYLSLFHTPNFAPAGPNYTHFSHPDFDRLYGQAASEIDESQRYKLYRRMDSLVMEEAPVVVLYYDQVLRFTSRQITGLGNNAMNLLNLKRVRIRQP